jgi:methyltransferase (TIGR00027 family)
MRSGRDKRAQASRTAAGAAMWRAVGATEPDPRGRNPDRLAHLFLPPAYRLLLLNPRLARWAIRRFDRRVPGGYCFETARTKHMDLLLRDQVAAGVSQVVILGAGYDTRAHRLAAVLDDTPIYEVDMPAILERKRRRLARYDGPSASGLRYVAVDRDHRDLLECLFEAGYEGGRRTLFVWSGVTMYLRPSAFTETLADIRRGSAPDSIVLFDYFSASAVNGTSDAHGARQIARRVEELGEPLGFGAEPDQMSALLERSGFELVSNLGPEELAGRYLQGTRGRSLNQPFGFAFIAEARSREGARA